MDKKFYAAADADADANGIRPKNNMSPTPFNRGDITTSDVPITSVKKAISSKNQITASVKMSGNSNSLQKSLKPTQSTSGINKKGGAINLDTEDESDDSSR